MNHTVSDVIAMFRGDMIASVIAVVLCAMGMGMLLLGILSARNSRSSFLYTGLFAMVYGTRLGINTSSFGLLSEHPYWLDYVRSSLEYLVPIPAALLFGSFSGRRWRASHRIIIGALVACAALAIPYEVLIRTPYVMKPVIDTLVIVLLAVLTLDLLWPGADALSWRLVRIGAAVFAVFVLNEHFRFVRDPYSLTREPTGFLFLMLTIVITTMQRGARAQERLVAVDSEMATARRIQMAALPNTNPSLTGLEVASIFAPASDVAGDFYDFLELEDGCLGVFIADVSGHGVPAALVASMLKIALATQSGNASSPARILSALNALFCGRLERQFITAAYVHVDPAKDRIVTASAGHPPPILRRTNGTAEEIVAPGVVLGRFRDARYEEIALPFAPGDTLVLYTDGVTETVNSDAEMWGDERLQATIAGSDPANVTSLATTILDDAATWRGRSGAPEDDVDRGEAGKLANVPRDLLLRVSLFRSRRRGAVDVPVVDDQVERLQSQVRRVTPVYGLAFVADDDVFHDAPDDVVEDGDAEEREAVSPGNEDGAYDHKSDARLAVEILLKVKLFVSACGASIDDRIGGGRGDVIRGAAEITRTRRLAGIAPEALFTCKAEEVDGRHSCHPEPPTPRRGRGRRRTPC